MLPDVLLELRILGSTDFDSRCILGIVLAGDRRLTEKLNTAQLLPLMSRMRAQLVVEETNSTDLADILRHATELAGNPELMTPGLRKTIVDNSMGNPRTMMHRANEVLAVAAQKGEKILTEEIYLELFKPALRRKR